MTERASVFEAVNIGIEVSPGTEVDANKRMEAWFVDPKRQRPINIFRPEGQKFGTLATVGKEHTEAAISGILDYANIVYLLSSLVSYAPPAQVLTTTAYDWTFEPNTNGPDTVKTLTVEKGSSVRAHQFEYGVVTALGFSFGAQDDQIALSGTMIGNELRDNITMTASPSTVEAVPVHPTHFAVKLAPTQAGLAGASALTRLLALDFNYSGKYVPVFAVDSNTSYVAVAEQAGELTCSVTVEADATGMGYLTHARAGTQYWVEIKATSTAEIETGYNWTHTIQMPVHFSNVGEISDQDGVVAVKYDMAAVHDGAWGKALSWVVRNSLSAL